MKQIFRLAAVLSLGGCSMGGVGSGSCGAASYSGYIGQPKSAMIGAGASGPVRFVGPSALATMDHEPTRLNVHIGEDGLIKRLSCG